MTYLLTYLLTLLQSINQSINMTICIAPNKQKSSEVLAAKQMRFELFCVSMESDEVRSSTGSLFHVTGPDTVKLRRPMVVLVRSKMMFHLYWQSYRLSQCSDTVNHTISHSALTLSIMPSLTLLWHCQLREKPCCVYGFTVVRPLGL